MKRYILLASFCLTAILTIKGNNNSKDSTNNVTAISAHYSFNFPGGDLQNRFGYNSILGGSFLYKTNKNWQWEFQGNFIFGDQVKEPTLLKGIETTTGLIIDGNGEIAEIALFERGFSFFVNSGKLFPILGSNTNSGLLLTHGYGFLQHKIRIENKNNTVPQIMGEYTKGYDHLSNGFAAKQFIGYNQMSDKNLINFYIGLEITEAWTKNRRSFDFDTMQKDTKSYFDMMYGIKIGWSILIQKRAPKEFYYN